MSDRERSSTKQNFPGAIEYRTFLLCLLPPQNLSRTPSPKTLHTTSSRLPANLSLTPSPHQHRKVLRLTDALTPSSKFLTHSPSENSSHNLLETSRKSFTNHEPINTVKSSDYLTLSLPPQNLSRTHPPKTLHPTSVRPPANLPRTPNRYTCRKSRTTPQSTA